MRSLLWGGVKLIGGVTLAEGVEQKGDWTVKLDDNEMVMVEQTYQHYYAQLTKGDTVKITAKETQLRHIVIGNAGDECLITFSDGESNINSYYLPAQSNLDCKQCIDFTNGISIKAETIGKGKGKGKDDGEGFNLYVNLEYL